MALPPLTALEIDKVFAAISDESLPLTTNPLHSESSNTIFNLLCPIGVPLSEKFIHYVTRILNITEANLTGIDMTNEYIAMLNEKNLTSLRLGYFGEMKEYEREPKYRADYAKYLAKHPVKKTGAARIGAYNNRREHEETIIDIVALLKDLLNDTSRQELIHLDLSPEPQREYDNIGYSDQFADGWAQAIGRMCPSLTSLSLRRRTISLKEFENLCLNFPNLKELDLTCSGIRSLTGISKLQNLESLKIGSICITEDERRSFKDLFKLTKLRHLSFEDASSSESGNTVEMYMESKKRLTELESVDFSGIGYFSDEDVKRFIDEHPTLKSVAFCETCGLDDLEYPGIEVYHSQSLQGVVKSLRYYTDMGNLNMVDALMNAIDSEAGGIDAEDSDFQQCMKQMNFTLEKFNFLKKVLCNGCRVYSELLRNHQVTWFDATDREKMINILLNFIVKLLTQLKHTNDSDSNIHCPWDVLNNRDLLFLTPHVDFSRICNLALKTTEYSGIRHWNKHLVVFDMLKDQVDFTAEVFQSIDIQKVFENLEKTVKHVERKEKPAVKRLLAYLKDQFAQ